MNCPIRCSRLPNASQWETPEVTMLSESAFGRSEVESRLNVSNEHAQYHTLECVASTEGEEAYTLFSISGNTIPTYSKLCTHTGPNRSDTRGD